MGELEKHLMECKDCTRDRLDEDGNAVLGEFCPVAMKIILPEK